MNDSETMLLLLFYVVLCTLTGAWSRDKGGSFIAGFFMAVIISPLLAGVILAVRRPLQSKAEEMPDQGSARRENVHPVIPIIVIAGSVAMVVYFVTTLSARGRIWFEQSSQNSEQKSHGNPSQQLTQVIGSPARIYDEDSTRIPVAVNEATLDEMLNHTRESDNRAYKKWATSLLTSGRIFLVTNNTAVIILDISNLKTKVKIMDGPELGKSGWLLKSFVVPLQDK